MRKAVQFAIISGLALTASLVGLDRSSAVGAASGGQINGSVVRFCSNGMRESWTTYHAPNNDGFFHQELVLGEGDYTLSLIPSGNFLFNAFVYEGDANRYIGGRQNVSSYTQRLRSGSWTGQKFLVQMQKTQQTCRGCSVTMVLTARNCPMKSGGSSNGNNAPLCKPNQCADPNGGVFGIPSCLYKKGARGGYCGTPGN